MIHAKVSIARTYKTHVYIKRPNDACDSRRKADSPRRASGLAAGVGRSLVGGQKEFGRGRLGTLSRTQHSPAGGAGLFLSRRRICRALLQRDLRDRIGAEDFA